MARTVLELRNWAVAQLHEAPATAILTDTLLPRWINQVYQKILTHKTWNWNVELDDITWPAGSTTSNVGAVLYLPSYIGHLTSMFPGSNIGRANVAIIRPHEIDAWRPGSGTTVNRDYLTITGLYGVSNEMVAQGVVNVASAGGTGTQNVLVEGVNSVGAQVREVVAVAAGGSTNTTATFDLGPRGVRRIVLLGDNAGNAVTTTQIITATSGGVTLVTIDSAWQRVSEHWRTELSAVASATSEYTVRYHRRHYEVFADADIVDLPFEFEDLFEYGMSERLAALLKDTEYTNLYRGMYLERLKELRSWDNRNPNRKIRLGVRRQWGGGVYR